LVDPRGEKGKGGEKKGNGEIEQLPTPLGGGGKKKGGIQESVIKTMGGREREKTEKGREGKKTRYH